MFDKLVRMQHFGLPTRLLDVTLNPLVGLYFATEVAEPKIEKPSDGKVYIFPVPPEGKKYFDSDAVSCIANLANLSDSEKQNILDNMALPKDEFNIVEAVERLLQFVRVEKPYFRPMINANDMLIVQFVIPKLNNRRIIPQNGAFLIFGLSVKNRLRGTVPIRALEVVVDLDYKQQIRVDLDKLGINASSLFPEIDRAAIYVARKFST